MTGSVNRPTSRRVAASRVTVVDLSAHVDAASVAAEDDAFAVEWQIESHHEGGRGMLADAGGGRARPQSD